uniref:Fatty acid desaturase domain-containing protein n=1 Tax=Pseudictyota dubia TaxID=2749911 RepID=A0A7R9W426_9STRA
MNVARFWLMKAVSMVYMVALPCYSHGAVKGMCLFMLGHFTCGELLATMFIVNHVIEGVCFAKKSNDGEATAKGRKGLRPQTAMGTTPMSETRSKASAANSELKEVPFNDWAAVQCQTSVNWSPGSWFWNHFSGGLSHQIEHHLFPSICHTNYVHIQDVVEKTCIEYGVPYQSEPSLLSAYKKMISHLRFLGTEKKQG